MNCGEGRGGEGKLLRCDLSSRSLSVAFRVRSAKAGDVAGPVSPLSQGSAEHGPPVLRISQHGTGENTGYM